FYDKWYGKGRWAFSTIYSNSIGQGEVETVPIQIANLAATIANLGYYITPHFVKSIEGQDKINNKYIKKRTTSVDKKHFEVVAEGMYLVVNEAGGTAVWGAKLDSIKICGKTGTVQNPHGKDHSGFFAFAPMEDPKIAIAVYVENAGFGGIWAAPIASLMIEKYLTAKISDELKEKRILEYRQF
ncbi:MAG: peptidoglycan glycosyltransferase, partial [Bacteroidetes bacterium]|nr:peptidoglycan glycosyltransferase [Bacteroidota bacterium]